ncbi:tetratricopeptide repeat protein, partial [Amycolatopsis rhizosphaerae]|uniref:tetratricopeptide repeat protein n=1 Tax=Amycolatopsis rhizosphaerae TaxID=2053003 RepID=UPI001C9526FB
SGSGRRLKEVGVFSPAEARDYLERRFDGDPDRLAEADLLAAELGFLPLALAQAAAYMLDRDLDCAAYRARLADRRRRLADVLPEDGALPDEQRETVAATWSLSVELADRLKPAGLAGPVLRLASVFDPAGFPAAVFTTAAGLAFLGRGRSGPPVTGDEAADAVRCLQRLSLAGQDAGTVRVHALVQRATREDLDAERFAELARAAAAALLEVWPGIEREPGEGVALRANAAALASHAGEVLWTAGGYEVLFREAHSLGDSGLLGAAVARWQELSAEAARRLGPDHEHTLLARQFLAGWRGVTGDIAGAAAEFDALSSDYRRVLGPDHLSTLMARSNLAHQRGMAGDATAAVAALEEVVADYRRVAGEDHQKTLLARQFLAGWRSAEGDAAGAAAEFAALLGDYRRVLGPDHPDTLSVRGNLAHQRGLLGDPAAAVRDFEALAADCARVLGPEHPQTLSTRARLAGWRGPAGDAAGAADAFAALLEDYLRIVGPDHPGTRQARTSLEYWRGQG